jgi:hypothetical protein
MRELHDRLLAVVRHASRLLGMAAMAALAGCASAAGPPTPSEPTAVSGVGPGISIADARASDSGEPLLVNGFLVIDPEGEVQLCSALAESDPPSCGGLALTVEELAIEMSEGLDESGGVRWSPDTVQLLGQVRGDTLEVSPGLLP